uniref:EGF-like calcium-binding domain-containing protein n=1 Tax=Salarias fasciatus TaxID=181472 RepID=A0A672J141_SALFA
MTAETARTRKGGFLCSCRPGYKPKATERHTCEGKTKHPNCSLTPKCSSPFDSYVFFPFLIPLRTDVNECEVYGTCPQDCKNTKGSYECFCAEGFLSFGEPHGTECAAQGIHSTREDPPQMFPFSLINTQKPQTLHRKSASAAFARQRTDPTLQPHIQALDYLWDPEGEGLSKTDTLCFQCRLPPSI